MAHGVFCNTTLSMVALHTTCTVVVTASCMLRIYIIIYYVCAASCSLTADDMYSIHTSYLWMCNLYKYADQE